MSQDSLDKIIKTDPDFQYDKNTERYHELWDESWHLEGKDLQQNYTDTRESEMNSKIEDIFVKTKKFYFSRNGVIVLLISVVLCVVTGTLSPEGLFFWNIILLIIVLGYYQLTSRIKVQPEWNEVWEELDEL